MRKEHKSHVVIIILMMLVILATFTVVIFNRPSEAGAGITTYVPPAGNMQTASQSMINPVSSVIPSSIEFDILIIFLIILALLFIWYVAIKIAKEFRR